MSPFHACPVVKINTADDQRYHARTLQFDETESMGILRRDRRTELADSNVQVVPDQHGHTTRLAALRRGDSGSKGGAPPFPQEPVRFANNVFVLLKLSPLHANNCGPRKVVLIQKLPESALAGAIACPELERDHV